MQFGVANSQDNQPNGSDNAGVKSIKRVIVKTVRNCKELYRDSKESTKHFPLLSCATSSSLDTTKQRSHHPEPTTELGRFDSIRVERIKIVHIWPITPKLNGFTVNGSLRRLDFKVAFLHK